MPALPRTVIAFVAVTTAVTFGAVYLILGHFEAEAARATSQHPATLFSRASAQPVPPADEPAPAKPAADADRTPAPNPADMGRMLMESLRSVEGCLGVDAGEMSSGKNVIIGWFEDAEAARRWYAHPAHRMLMGMAGARANDDEKPLAHVEEGVPLMVIAAITFTDRPEIRGIPIPISQISIEVYQAAPGGAYINGKLAPESFEVEHMKNLTTPQPD